MRKSLKINILKIKNYGYYGKVRDHGLYQGEYRASAHSIYNLKYSLTKKFL